MLTSAAFAVPANKANADKVAIQIRVISLSLRRL
jgi:hypothetical protein